MTASEMRPMELGEVLDRSFQTLRRHFGVLFATAVIGLLPLLVFYLVVGTPYTLMESSQPGAPVFSGALIFLMIVGLLMTAVVWAALTAQVDASASGGVVAVGDGFRAGFRSLLSMIAAGILVYLMMVLLMIPVLLVVGVLSLVGGLTGSAMLTGLLATVGGVVAGGLALVIWLSIAFLTVPALVIEKVGPIKAIRRANELVKGGRLGVCAISILAYLAVLLPTFGLGFVLGVGSVLWNPHAAGQVGASQMYLYQAAMVGASALTTPFMVAAMVFTYYDRRVRREGYDVELASASAGMPE